MSGGWGLGVGVGGGRSEVLMAMDFKLTVFSAVMSCSLVEICHPLVEICGFITLQCKLRQQIP